MLHSTPAELCRQVLSSTCLIPCYLFPLTYNYNNAGTPDSYVLL